MGNRPVRNRASQAVFPDRRLCDGWNGRGSTGASAGNPLPPPSSEGEEMTQLSETATALCVLLIFLVPLAAAGLSLINAGLGRSRSAAHSMLSSLAILAVAVLVYFFCGFSWQGFAAGPAHVVTVAGKAWNWIAAEPFFLRGLPPQGSAASLSALRSEERMVG